jgi:hypothetical protein
MANANQGSGENGGSGASGSGPSDEKMRQAHEESLAAAHHLEAQVEQVEQAEGKPEPSQADADETAATGI